jgi:hypothetical protein
MAEVYLLWHSHGSSDDEDELIGVYGSRRRARAAVDRLRDRPGFRDAPDIVNGGSDGPGFVIVEYGVDVDHWVEGHRPADQVRLVVRRE